MTPTTHHHIAIVGTGFSGLCAAIKLKQAGFHDFVIFERSDDVGGTWRDNSYPGAACDVPSVLYSFSFAQNPDWSRKFAPWNETRDYLRKISRDFGIDAHIRFSAEVTELRFDDAAADWAIRLRSGEKHRAAVVISAVGVLSQPSIPNIEGLDTFTGSKFHSAKWRHDVDLTGKRVAVIGTGASAIQFVPEIAAQVGQLYVFQRSPHWVLPRNDRPISTARRRLYQRLPLLQRVERWRTYWEFELLSRGFLGMHPKVVADYRAKAITYLEEQVGDPDLRTALTPDYDPGCKRRLISDEWYPALQRHNVRLITDHVAKFTTDAVVTDSGSAFEVDAIVFGTGFTATDFLAPMKVFGRGGVELSDSWKQGAATKLGIATHGFPSLFMLYGPNSGLGHNSIVFMIEAQARYITNAIRHIDSGNALDLRLGAQAKWYGETQRKMADTVWATGGCTSWYKSPNGRIDTLWPDITPRYWKQARRFDIDDYRSVSPALTTPRLATDQSLGAR